MSLCGFFFTSLLIFSANFIQTWGGSALDQETFPSPALVQLFSGVSTGVVLRCRAPRGHGGRVFELYRLRTLTHSLQFDSERSHADFQLSTSAADMEELYCCRYDHSMFSPYLHLPSPPRRATPPAPPHLSIIPPDGRVRSGQVVEFNCQAPPTFASVTFVLQKQRQEDENFQVVNYSTNPHFRVGPVGVADEGVYVCYYSPAGVQNSTHSAPVYVKVELPAPHLSPGGEKVLVCTGSASYPGAHFSLFQQGSSAPLATKPANMIQHSVQFSASGQQGDRGGFQCQYSVLLGNKWAHSELSTPITLPCDTGSPSCNPSSTGNQHVHTGSMDLALVCGSVSAALLFLMVLIIVAFVIHKYAKTAAKNRRQKEQQQFWQQVHSGDHVVDLPLQRFSTGSKEERVSSVTEPIYDYPLHTFTNPPGY